jgi:DNA-binding transcriptional ArsR family regulator
MTESIDQSALHGRSLERAAETLRLLAHPVRLKLIDQIRAGPVPVGVLAKLVRQPQHVVSQHLNRMRLHGILSRRRNGRQVIYRISDPQVLDILRWVQKRRFADPTFSDGEAI